MASRDEIALSDDEQRCEHTVHMSRDKMLDVRENADNGDQPCALYEGQRIIGYREWKGGTLYMPGAWCAVLVLADGTRLQIT